MDKTKRILITGANSFIGESFKKWVSENHAELISVDTVDMLSDEWKNHDFVGYDSVFHVAGLAHADVDKISDEEKRLYYEVNCDLALAVAKKAKNSGVKQFIFMSSMIVYGEVEGRIDLNTEPRPANFYGDSKWQADKALRELATDEFKPAVIRAPMIYGRGAKGNYLLLSKIAKKTPIFPDFNNERSMLYIDNLCEFVAKLALSGQGGIFFPQNRDYVKTSDMVKLIAKADGKRIIQTRSFNFLIRLMLRGKGKIGRLTRKAFGNLSYDMKMSEYGFDYQLFNLEESIMRIEK